MEPVIRNAMTDDAAALLAIYAPYVAESCVSFETEVPSLLEFSKRIEEVSERYPFLVCECGGEIAGYTYATKFKERAAYRFSVTSSIYIAPGFKGKGLGKKLYNQLFERLREQGYYGVYAGISLPNDASVGLHKAVGFTEVGVYHNVGYKLGRWIDSLWLEKFLREFDEPTF